MYVGSWLIFCGTPWELTKHSWMFVRFHWGYLQITFCYTTHVFQCFMSYVYISICVNRLTFLSEKQNSSFNPNDIGFIKSPIVPSYKQTKLYIRVYQKSNDGSFPILNPTFNNTGYFLRWMQWPTKSFSGVGFSYSWTFASSSSAEKIDFLLMPIH